MSNKQLTGKLFIKGKITAVTGLHIGGSKSSMEIGGVDLNVIKTSEGIPFIPGTSLKGKLRTMLARYEGSIAHSKKEAKGGKSDEDIPYIIELFGSSPDDNQNGETTRLIVRDAFLDADSVSEDKKKNMDFSYSYVKWENTIARRNSKANPRQVERVPAGSTFSFRIVYDVYSDTTEDYVPNSDKDTTEIQKRGQRHLNALTQAFQMLEDDYLGGHGTRGYGEIKFSFDEIFLKEINNGIYQKRAELNAPFADFATNLKAQTI